MKAARVLSLLDLENSHFQLAINVLTENCMSTVFSENWLLSQYFQPISA